MSKKNIQRAAWLLAHPLWVVSVIVLTAWGIIAPIVDYVVPPSWYDWLAAPLGSLVLTALRSALATVLVIVPLVLIKRFGRSELYSALGIAARPQLKMIPWALFAWGLYFSISIVVSLLLLSLHIPGLDMSQKQQIGFSGLEQGYEFVAAFLALVVLAPIFEEIIFRGYLYGRLRAYGGPVLSAVLTSSAFAIVHLQLNVSIDVFILSLFLCFLREKFDSIWPGVFVHAFKNGLAYIFLFILPLYGINLIQ